MGRRKKGGKEKRAGKRVAGDNNADISYLCKKLSKNKSPAKSGSHRFPVWLVSFCS